MRKGVAVFLGCLAVLLTAAVAFVYVTEDREGPQISFGTELVYTGADTSELLNGVTARDDQDGDVSDTLRVDSLQIQEKLQQAVVTYIAKDSNNNVTKLSKNIAFAEGALQSETSEAEPEAQSEDTTQSEPAEPEPQPEDIPQPEPAEPTKEEENDSKIAELAEGAPAFYLTSYEETLAAGSEFQPLGYVEEITDDADNRNWLFQHIQILGEVDTNTPGVYEVTYYVIDSDGNYSNNAVLTVTVE